MKRSKPFIYTAGEPAGIGLDLAVQLVAHAEQGRFKRPVILYTDPHALQQRAAALQITPFHVPLYDPQQPAPITCQPFPFTAPVIAGQLDIRHAATLLATLQAATATVMAQQACALITGPVHKGVINDAGFAFTGHTELLAELTHAPPPVMMLANATLRVVLATIHMPLKDVPNAITADTLTHVLRTTHHSLQRDFGIRHPRLRVCGLNPHAGEQGHLGREEMDIMMPTLEKLRQTGLSITGPVAADTAFIDPDIDAIVAMYHDQGLAAIKALDFHHTVNITLGLPIIRTSVDHGTALSLAGTGKADIRSLLSAFDQAEMLVTHREHYDNTPSPA